MKQFVSGGLLLITLLAGCQFGKELSALSQQSSQEQAATATTEILATKSSLTPTPVSVRLTPTVITPILPSTVTPTPTPATNISQLTPTPIPIVISPSSPTHPTVLPPPPSSGTAEVRVEIRTNSKTVKVGEMMTVTAASTGIGIPYYTLNIETNPAVTITYDNRIKYQGDTGQFVEFISASATHSRVEFVLQALHPGPIEVSIDATGEVYLDYGGGTGAWSWSGAASENITITVVQ